MTARSCQPRLLTNIIVRLRRGPDDDGCAARSVITTSVSRMEYSRFRHHRKQMTTAALTLYYFYCSGAYCRIDSGGGCIGGVGGGGTVDDDHVAPDTSIGCCSIIILYCRRGFRDFGISGVVGSVRVRRVNNQRRNRILSRKGCKR